MKIKFLLSIALFYLIGCNNLNQEKKNQNISVEKTSQIEKPSLINYVYTVIKVDEPEITSELVDINKFERESIERDNKYWNEVSKKSDGSWRVEGDEVVRPANLPPLPEYKKQYSEISHFKYSVSDVVEVENINEDKKYKLMDEYEKKVKQHLYNDDLESYINTNYEHKRRSKIISREIFTFNSYAEASVSRGNYK